MRLGITVSSGLYVTGTNAWLTESSLTLLLARKRGVLALDPEDGTSLLIPTSAINVVTIIEKEN